MGATEAPSAPWCPLNLSHLSRSIYMSTCRLARPTLELTLIALLIGTAQEGQWRPQHGRHLGLQDVEDLAAAAAHRAGGIRLGRREPRRLSFCHA